MWWIIIGAVIALIVMIVLLVMFTGKSGTLEKGILDCEGKGGTCFAYDSPQPTFEQKVATENSKCKDGGGTISSAFTCTNAGTGSNAIPRFCCFEG